MVRDLRASVPLCWRIQADGSAEQLAVHRVGQSRKWPPHPVHQRQPRQEVGCGARHPLRIARPRDPAPQPVRRIQVQHARNLQDGGCGGRYLVYVGRGRPKRNPGGYALHYIHGKLVGQPAGVHVRPRRGCARIAARWRQPIAFHCRPAPPPAPADGRHLVAAAPRRGRYGVSRCHANRPCRQPVAQRDGQLALRSRVVVALGDRDGGRAAAPGPHQIARPRSKAQRNLRLQRGAQVLVEQGAQHPGGLCPRYDHPAPVFHVLSGQQPAEAGRSPAAGQHPAGADSVALRGQYRAQDRCHVRLARVVGPDEDRHRPYGDRGAGHRPKVPDGKVEFDRRTAVDDAAAPGRPVRTPRAVPALRRSGPRHAGRGPPRRNVPCAWRDGRIADARCQVRTARSCGGAPPRAAGTAARPFPLRIRPANCPAIACGARHAQSAAIPA